jgi:26S proteasome regulatory subunit N1
VEQIEKIVPLADEHSYERICMYLSSIASYAGSRDDSNRIFRVSLEINVAMKQLPQALRIAMKLNSIPDITRIFGLSTDPAVTRQLAHMLGRQGLRIASLLPEKLHPLLNQDSLSKHYKDLGKELDVLEPKTPEEIFKTHLEEKRTTVQLDSAKQNLAASFANAFVNVGFGTDKLLTVEGSGWLFKNKDLGMFSTAASLGMLMLWDLDEGMNQIDKFQWSTDVNVKAGALLAFGMTASGVNNEVDPAWALLAEHLENTDQPLIKQAAILGLGFAYAATRREELLEHLTPIMIDSEQPLETAALSATSLGLSFVGSGSEDVSILIQQCLIDKVTQKTKLDGTNAAFLLPCALGLVWLGLADTAQSTVDSFAAQLTAAGAEERFVSYARVVVESFAFAGTGDVLRVQKLLQTCAEAIPENASAADALVPEAAALLGVAMVAVGEEIGSEMCLRTFDRIHQYGNIAVKRVIPLAIAFLNLSHPRPAVIDTLSKLSHESDPELAANAIFAMGLIGLGTNNSRLAGLFRQLAAYFTKDATMLFVIRLAQGLLYCGKGLVTCNPVHSDRLLISAPALGSLAILFQAVLAMKANLFSTHHYLLFFLVPALTPRMLVTLDADTGAPLPLTVRVGQAVDVTGQAGKPKTVTGFQTHTTPVLLGHGERAELATEEYLALTPVLEGLVLVRKNPDFRQQEDR